jgi:quercetin dioxygenase-like cupin family protein
MDFSKRQEHSVAEPLLSFDLAEMVRSLKLEKQWKTEDRDAITLIKTSSLRIVLMVLHAGTTMEEHVTDGPISAQLLSGSVEFKIRNNTTHLKSSSLLSLAGGIPHSVRAIEESVLLLTVIPKRS